MFCHTLPQAHVSLRVRRLDGQSENTVDVKALYALATKSRPIKKLVVYGGLHGVDPTGVPSGQEPSEKKDILPGDAVVTVAGTSVTSFVLDDLAMKRAGTGLNFTYKGLSKYTTKGSDMTATKQAELVEDILRHHGTNGYYILLGWCYSRTWALARGM